MELSASVRTLAYKTGAVASGPLSHLGKTFAICTENISYFRVTYMLLFGQTYKISAKSA